MQFFSRRNVGVDAEGILGSAFIDMPTAAVAEIESYPSYSACA